jgi:hypothetical protein
MWRTHFTLGALCLGFGQSRTLLDPGAMAAYRRA